MKMETNGFDVATKGPHWIIQRSTMTCGVSFAALKVRIGEWSELWKVAILCTMAGRQLAQRYREFAIQNQNLKREFANCHLPRTARESGHFLIEHSSGCAEEGPRGVSGESLLIRFIGASDIMQEFLSGRMRRGLET
ncbi:unnamed protein product [Ranitomeya imitator]|uniref:Uncharacterized protein n=1 Tax=Ranitomeya imitator TaxID=111125 RepID=A0ABN9L2T2_9NEOB|nr:unnamed protein product [Ranitomeya imitator]